MNADRKHRIFRPMILAAYLSVVLWCADYFCGGYNPKSLGWLLGAAAGVFLIGEAFFWKAIDKLSELPHSEALSARQTSELLDAVQILKKRLTQRWLILLCLKAVAGACAVWLVNQSTQGTATRSMWLIGVGTLTASLPLALTFVRNWQQADTIKNQHLLGAKIKKEHAQLVAELEQSPKQPLVIDPAIAEGYTTAVSKPAKVKRR